MDITVEHAVYAGCGALALLLCLWRFFGSIPVPRISVDASYCESLIC